MQNRLVFVYANAHFFYVTGDQVMAAAERDGAIPYDMPDVELGRHGAECSFDAVTKKDDRPTRVGEDGADRARD